MSPDPSDGYVLVVGAAHPDIFADYERSETGHIDKVGELQYSIGGTAYNIAINLSQKYVDVALYTYIKEDSIFADLITKRLDRNGVNTEYVQYDAHMPESGFVGIREDGELVSAVTASGITEAVFDEAALETAVRDASLVVLDCNLAETQIALTVRLAEKHGTRTIASGVSETKSTRIEAAPSEVTVFSMNDDEACHFFDVDRITPENLLPLVADSPANTVVVTEGRDGYMVSDGTTTNTYDAPETKPTGSASGTGDALLAAIAHSIHETGRLQWADASDRITEYVTDVLDHEGSTVGATTKRQELSIPDRINDQVRAIAGYSRWEKAALAVGTVGAMVTISSFLFGDVSLEAVRSLLDVLPALPPGSW